MSVYEEKISFYNQLIRGLSFGLALLSFVLICVAVHEVFVVARKIDQRSAQTEMQINQVDIQVGCIAEYFNTQGRTGNTTLNSLSNCSIRR